MQALIMHKTFQLSGVSPGIGGEVECGKVTLEPTNEHPLGYGSTTCKCGVVFNVCVRKNSLVSFVLGKLALEAPGGDKTGIHVAKLVKE